MQEISRKDRYIYVMQVQAVSTTTDSLQTGRLTRALTWIVSRLVILLSNKTHFLIALFTNTSEKPAAVSVSTEQTDMAARFHSFQQAAFCILQRSNLFHPREISDIIRRLRGIHAALDQYPFFTATQDKFDRGLKLELYIFLQFASVLLGIRTQALISCINFPSVAANKLSTWLNQAQAFIGTKFFFAILFEDPKYDDLYLIDIDQATQVISNYQEFNPSDRGPFPSIHPQNQGVLLQGMLFGYPQSAIRFFLSHADGSRHETGKINLSRWTEVAIRDEGEAPRIALDRFDAAVELLADYLSVVRKVPMENLSQTMRCGYYTKADLGFVLPPIGQNSEARN